MKMSEERLYKIGDIVVFAGLLDTPDLNGKMVTIIGCCSIEPDRIFCPSGRAYYLTETPKGYDCIYEECLRPAPPLGEG
jgi:hypothetical protein